METAALILQGKDDFTANKPVAGVLPLQRIIRTLKYAGIKRVVLAGDEYIMGEAFNHVTRLEAEFIHPTRSKKKILSYQLNAVTYLKDKCEKMLVVPAYYPLFDISTAKRMADTDAALAAPVFKGKRGYPVLVFQKHFDDLIRTNCDVEKLFNENPWEKIAVDDEGVTADVTGTADVEAIAAKLALRQKMRPGFKLTLRREASVYGPGMQELIRLVGETGSLQQTFTLMGMSAAYGRRLIAETEAGLGFRIFETIGSRYNRTIVSEEVKEFAAKYKAFHEDCVKLIEDSFKRHFG